MTEEQRNHLRAELKHLSDLGNDESLDPAERINANGRWAGIHYALEVLGEELHVPYTVGDLIKELEKFPKDLEVFTASGGMIHGEVMEIHGRENRVILES